MESRRNPGYGFDKCLRHGYRRTKRKGCRPYRNAERPRRVLSGSRNERGVMQPVGRLRYCFMPERDKATLHKRLTEEFPDKEFILKVYERVGNFLEIALGCGMDSIYEFNLKRFCTTFK